MISSFEEPHSHLFEYPLFDIMLYIYYDVGEGD